ncbi:hypothetical protein FBY12_1241 [Pseudomonas sp. SJZ131]|nr:hypothetical protein FBY12_1241 [Pseudomonas sp. SJZ131]
MYITGASCAGVTTLGQNLATLLGVRHVDVDDFYWMPTNPPFTNKRPAEERVSLIQQKFADEDWVLSGSCMGWGEALIAPADLIVFVVTPTPIRLERLAARETQRFGNRIAPGGDMHEITCGFSRMGFAVRRSRFFRTQSSLARSLVIPAEGAGVAC